MRNTLSINTPGAAGVDLRAEPSDQPPVAALEMRNLEILLSPGDATRVRPRMPLRRFGTRTYGITLADGGSGTFTGTYWYRYVWTDGNGNKWLSRAEDFSASGSGTHITVSGWPTSAGTVAIYRSVDGGDGTELKLVTSGIDVTAVSSYDDSTADGALGATLSLDPVAPFGNEDFDQGVRVDWMIPYVNAAGTPTLAMQVRDLNGGSPNTGTLHFIPYGNDGLPKRRDVRVSSATMAQRAAFPSMAAMLFDLLIVTGGTNNAYYYELGGASAYTALAQASQPTLSSASQAAGALSANTGHQYVTQKVNTTTGIRSLPSEPLEFAGPYTSKENSFTSSTSAGTRLDIYRTSDGGAFFQFLKSQSSGSIDDEAQDSELSQETVSFEVGAPGGSRYVAAHKGTLFTWHQTDTNGTTDPCLLRWAAVERLMNFPEDPLVAADYERQIEDADGDEGSGMLSWGEILLLFKRRRLYALTGDPPTGFRWARVPGSEGRGCVAGRTIQETAIGVLYYSPAGVCLLRDPGAAPVVVSDPIRDALVEPGRRDELAPDAAAPREAPAFFFNYSHAEASSGAIAFQVQLDDSAAFDSVDFDWDTENSAELPYFLVNAAPAGATTAVTAGKRVRVEVRPPSGGPTPGTAYYVRWRSKNVDGSNEWGAWTTLTGTFTWPADEDRAGGVNWDALAWAFAVHYPARKEYLLFLPRAGETWCDRYWVLNYDALESGGAPIWRGPNPCAATCGALVPGLQIVDDGDAVDRVLLASPDGLLYAYPGDDTTADYDTGATVAAADRRVSATLSGSTLTASGTSWPTTQFGLAGSIIAATAADGEQYSGLVTASTGTTLTVVWLGGRSPAEGVLSIVIGGLDACVVLPWLQLGGGRNLTAVVRELAVHSLGGSAPLRLDVHAGESARRDPRGMPTRSATVPTGPGFEQVRAGIDLAGNVHRVRVQCPERGQRWELAQLTAEYEQTGSLL